MRKMIIAAGLAIGVGLLCISPAPVFAHETITVGEYAIEYGWQNEPPVAGQPNALFFHIAKGAAGHPEEATPAAGQDAAEDSAGEPASAVEVSGLTVSIVYGDQTKNLTLQPLGEEAPGAYIVPLTPTIPGIYTVRLGGQLGGAPVSVEVQPEEVHPADAVQFPLAEGNPDAAPEPFGLAGWLGLAGIVLGLAGIGLGLAALRKT